MEKKNINYSDLRIRGAYAVPVMFGNFGKEEKPAVKNAAAPAKRVAPEVSEKAGEKAMEKREVKVASFKSCLESAEKKLREIKKPKYAPKDEMAIYVGYNALIEKTQGALDKGNLNEALAARIARFKQCLNALVDFVRKNPFVAEFACDDLSRLRKTIAGYRMKERKVKAPSFQSCLESAEDELREIKKPKYAPKDEVAIYVDYNVLIVKTQEALDKGNLNETLAARIARFKQCLSALVGFAQENPFVAELACEDLSRLRTTIAGYRMKK